MRLLSIPLLAAMLVSTACGGPPPMRESDRKGEVVPVNAAGKDYKEGRAPAETPPPSSAPVTSEPEPSHGPPSIPGPPPPTVGKGDTSGRVGKDECDKSFDHYIDLASQGMGLTIPPELRAQVRAQTTSQAGSDPCASANSRPTRKQYSCAMAAKVKDAWEACMK